MDQQKTDIIRHIRAQLEEHKRAVYLYYAEVKLKLPTHIKRMTIQRLRDAGGDIAQSTSQLRLPREAENILKQQADSMRKNAELLNRLRDIHEAHRKQTLDYYRNCKRELPKELFDKILSELDNADADRLGLVRNDHGRFIYSKAIISNLR